MPQKPPRKWLGRGGGWILLGAFAILWAFSAIVCVLWLHFQGNVVSMLILGSFAVAALFIYSMCYRLRPLDGITPQLLVLVFVFGGFIAWVASRVVEPLWGAALGAPKPLPLGYQFGAPVLEEICKILVVVVIARWVTVRNARTGLFIGGAVGFGFASFENIEKGLSTFENFGHFIAVPANFAYSAAIDELSLNVALREVLTPFGHPVWTSIAAAALFAGSRNGRLRIGVLFAVGFISVAIVHTLWDLLPSIFNLTIRQPQTAVNLSYVVYAVLGVAGALAWNTIRRRANRKLTADALEMPVLPVPLVEHPTN